MAKFTLIASLLAAAVSSMPAMPAGAQNAPPSLPNADPEAIMAKPQSSFKSYQTGGLVRATPPSSNSTEDSSLSKRWTCSTSPILTWGDEDNGGPGITIDNAADGWRGFYLFHNKCDDVPWKYIWIAGDSTQFVSVPEGWEGRVQRGVDSDMLSGKPQMLGSWLEVSWKDNLGWGDVSLIRGCDGAILMWNEDGSWKGFTQWILTGAPYGAYDMKNDGEWVIKYTEEWSDSNEVLTIPRNWDLEHVSTEDVYVDDHHGNPVISTTSNQRFHTYWPDGRA